MLSLMKPDIPSLRLVAVFERIILFDGREFEC